jgi:hypothetical protein
MYRDVRMPRGRKDAPERRMHRDVRMPWSASAAQGCANAAGAGMRSSGDAPERRMHPSPGLRPASPSRERRKGARAADAHGCANAVERKCCTWTCECRGRRDALERRCAGAAERRMHREARMPPHPDCVRPLLHKDVRMPRVHGCTGAAPQGEAKESPLPLRERVGVRGRAAVRALQTNSKT